MRVYVHGAGKETPEMLEVSSEATIRELVAAPVDGEGVDFVWLEEADEPLALDTTLEAAGIHHGGHVYRGRCRRVNVTVRYNGAKTREFPPSATVASVFEWATGEHGFNLTPEERAKHVLALPGADHPLDPRVHIGSLATEGGCDVLLDLAPKVRFEG